MSSAIKPRGHLYQSRFFSNQPIQEKDILQEELDKKLYEKSNIIYD